jgi:hypothetical protein
MELNVRNRDKKTYHSNDTISEQEYTLKMKASTLPQNDSPGDSESDAGVEFQVGLDYEPDSKRDRELPDEESSIEVEEEIPETARVVDSDQPSPWMDGQAPSDTH